MRCGLDREGRAVLTNRILRQKHKLQLTASLVFLVNCDVPYCHTVHSAILSMMTSYFENYDDKSDDWSGNDEFS